MENNYAENRWGKIIKDDYEGTLLEVIIPKTHEKRPVYIQKSFLSEEDTIDEKVVIPKGRVIKLFAKPCHLERITAKYTSPNGSRLIFHYSLSELENIFPEDKYDTLWMLFFQGKGAFFLDDEPPEEGYYLTN